jgi:hypothetical protein
MARNVCVKFGLQSVKCRLSSRHDSLPGASHPGSRLGRSARAFKAGDTFTVPTHAVHGGKVSDTELKLIGVDVEGRSPRLR